ncbi:MAG TPA: hypothetical protein VFZ65_16710 [Planctomycetota bacterium]|nr:hypothetical protein [Planctomycetota bacterium]
MHTTRCVAAAALVGLGLPAQSPATRVAVDAGPLLCFTTAEQVSGARENVHWVASLHGDGPAAAFWRSRDNAAVLRRLDRDHLLVASFGTPYALLVVDLAAGSVRELAPDAPHGFVAVHADDVLYLGDRRDAARDDFLYATPWREPGERRRLAEARLHAVPVVQGNLAVAIGADEREVWVVSLVLGKGRRVWQAPGSARSLRLALSPAGQRLAIGHVDADGRGNLSVVDTGTGDTLRSWSALPIQVSAESSSTPTLEVGWLDDAHVVCSETRGDVRGLRGNFVFVARDLATGDVTDETVYSRLGLQHRAPPVPGAIGAPEPLFEIAADGARSVLRRVGEPEPLAQVERKTQQFGDLTVSRDGCFAAARVDGSHRLVLFTAASRQPRDLVAAWAYDLTWLPAAP